MYDGGHRGESAVVSGVLVIAVQLARMRQRQR
jgi:hypothetical protein